MKTTEWILPGMTTIECEVYSLSLILVMTMIQGLLFDYSARV